MIDIQLEGLTQRQIVIADMIWACGTKSEVDRLIKFLPTQEMKDEAESIVQMMIMATVEQCYDGISPMDEATKVLKRIAKKT
jgi:hypothetical protein